MTYDDMEEFCSSNMWRLEKLISATDSLKGGGFIYSMFKSKMIYSHSYTDLGEGNSKMFPYKNDFIVNIMSDLELQNVTIDSCGTRVFNFYCDKNTPKLKYFDSKSNCAMTIPGKNYKGFYLEY